MRAAILTALMNFAPMAPVDVLRFLRLPAIVLTLRGKRAHTCSAAACRVSRRR
jgi:hypothetical protein